MGRRESTSRKPLSVPVSWYHLLMSLLLPSFLGSLADPAVRTVLLCGCGGGFDFVHGLALYPELERLGKNVILHSYSFGDPGRISGGSIVSDEGGALVKLVDASCVPDPHYGPEVHACSFLDERYADEAPHRMYASYARSWTVERLLGFYRQLVAEHAIDAVVVVDGGSDSLMVGDESGLGDPIEDAVSVAAVARLDVPGPRVLVSVGFGADRYNDVSDAASLRAVAELTAQGGFLGAVALEPKGEAFCFYRDLVSHIYERQRFRSVLAGTILSAVEGGFGGDEVPSVLADRVRPGQLYLWPLMGVLWAFDAAAVARRSLIVQWIADCETPNQCHLAVGRARSAKGQAIRADEDLPRHADMAANRI